MCLPRGGDDDNFYIFVSQKCAVIGVDCRCVAPVVSHLFGGIFRAVCITVADGDHVHIREIVKHIPQQAAAPLTKTNESKF